MSTDERKFLGQGMKFPPQVDPGSGRFVLSSGAQSVKESVYMILMTHRGERWLQPGFGSRIMSYTFMDMTPTMMGIMAGDIRSVLLDQEPRISGVDVDIDPEAIDGALVISISYTISDTNTPDNLVFPFYLNAVPEEGDYEEAE